MKAYIIIAATITLGAMVACKSKQAATSSKSASTNSSTTATSANAATTAGTSNTGISQQTVVYKTKADYSQYVPVTLSADKSKVVSYPGLKDIYYQDKLAYPTSLTDGYWLDNRGINANTAFLEITYKEYSALTEVPPLEDLIKRIKDSDPFVEIYNLGDRSRFKDEIGEINEIITKGGLKKFTKIK